MAIVYAVVARGTVVLAEFSAVTGNTGAISRRILEKLPTEADTRLCFSQDRYIFHILRIDGLTFLCMANDTFGSTGEEKNMRAFEEIKAESNKIKINILEYLQYWPAVDVQAGWLFRTQEYYAGVYLTYGIYILPLRRDRPLLRKPTQRRIPFSYLEDIHMRFMKNYGKVAHSAPAYAMNDEFSRVLHQQMEYFSSNPSADTLDRVRGEVGEIRTIMVENIEKILERGDRIELLVDKTATMQDSAFHFKKQSRRLRRSLWMKNAKLLAMLTCLIVLLLYIIIAAACGGITLPSCRS